MLRGWGKKGGTETRERSGQSERFSASEADTLKAVRVIAERPETGGVVLLAELHEETRDPKSTLSDRRDALIEIGFLAPNDSRGAGGFVLTPIGLQAVEERQRSKHSGQFRTAWDSVRSVRGVL